MTYNEWEGELLSYLGNLPLNEKLEIKEYYREMYGDKRDAGMSNAEILKKFGTPRLVAAKILNENAGESTAEVYTNEYTQKEQTKRIENEENKQAHNYAPYTPSKSARRINPASIVGWFFLITIVIIPFEAVFISLIASFGAVALSGAAMLIAGFIATLASPFALLLGYSGTTVLLTAGACLVTAGVGAILCPLFVIITRYTAISTYKLNRYIFLGGGR